MKMVSLPSGRTVPALGQGTWLMGERSALRRQEIAALRDGLERGLSLIDTAEMYAEGGAEELVADVIAGRRADVFLVSKVYPHNATRRGAIEACHRSLRRLRTDYLDLYLLHWPGAVPIEETLEAFRALQDSGLIAEYGVSNFDRADMERAARPPGGAAIATNQVLYNLRHRGVEFDLLPWCRSRSIPVMAYSPFEHSPAEQRGMLDHPTVLEIGRRISATPAQVALAWVLRHPDVIAIPKAADPKHVRENRAAVDLRLSEQDLAELDRAFPPPRGETPLAMR